MSVRAHVWIEGRVQGVSYRAWTRREATRLGVSGWVRNLPDQRVEAVFEGPDAKVREILSWCWTGSPDASVTRVAIQWEPAQGETAFVVL